MLILFVRADIENPSFDSQTKDNMNTPSSNSGSACLVSNAFIEKVATRRSRVARDLAGQGQQDGEQGGQRQDQECPQHCEFHRRQLRGHRPVQQVHTHPVRGAVCDVRGVGRHVGRRQNIYGIYPHKRKLLNVRGENTRRIGEYKEIADMKKVLELIISHHKKLRTNSMGWRREKNTRCRTTFRNY
jgi:DNA topoisomerase II